MINNKRVDLGVMAMKSYYTFPEALELKPHHMKQFSVPPPQDSRCGGGLTPLLRCSRCIVQP